LEAGIHVVQLTTSDERSEELLRIQDLPLPNPMRLLAFPFRRSMIGKSGLLAISMNNSIPQTDLLVQALHSPFG